MGKFDALLDKKNKVIQEISKTKELGMEFSNCLNNAVAVWRVCRDNKLEVEKELPEIMDLVDFFRGMKAEVKRGITEQEAVDATKQTFPGSEVIPPGTQQSPPTAVDPITQPQRGKMFALLKEAGHTDKASQLERVRAILYLPPVTSFEAINDGKGLSKSQASAVIKQLMEK